MLKTVLINLRNYVQWGFAGAMFFVDSRRTVVVLTPPPIVVGQNLFLFKTQRVLQRDQRRIVAVAIAYAVEFYVLRNLFYNEDYNLARLSQWPNIKAGYERIVNAGKTPLIIDCGANIGLSAVYFALQFPAARIVAIEPHIGNCARALSATQGFQSVRVVRGGIASEAGSARIVDPGLSTDAYRTELSDAGDVPMLTVGDLLQEEGPSTEPFAIKIDIEGFESNLFERNTGWIEAFPVLIIELHDWMLPQQSNSRNFLRAISRYKRDFVYIGENVFSIRNGPETDHARYTDTADIPTAVEA
jgi:FkbM family methyltransferase